MARVSVLPEVPSIPLLGRKVKVSVCLSLLSRHGGTHRSEGLKASLAARPGRELHLVHQVLPLSSSQGHPTLCPLPKQPSELCLQDPHPHCFYLSGLLSLCPFPTQQPDNSELAQSDISFLRDLTMHLRPPLYSRPHSPSPPSHQKCHSILLCFFQH